MAIVLGKPGVDGLGEAVGVLRECQYDGAPMQLHPGDLGWFWRFGAEATAAAVRTWSRDGQILAVGLLDGPKLLRLTIATDAQRDEELARQLVADVTEPERGVLIEGKVSVEAPLGAMVRDLLFEDGWNADEPWTPLRRDLTEPVKDPGVRIEVIGPEQAHVRTAVQRASFDRSTFTDERWHAMATGLPYADARCLVTYDDQGNAVAAVTVWSAGPGKPGLLEPMGVRREHRGHGYGKAITVAAAAALRELGSSSAIVCTPSVNVGAVATYKSAGFQQLPERRDQCRDAEKPRASDSASRWIAPYAVSATLLTQRRPAQPQTPEHCGSTIGHEIGEPGLTPHALRHPAASLAVSAGANVRPCSACLATRQPLCPSTAMPIRSTTIWTPSRIDWTPFASPHADHLRTIRGLTPS